MKKISVVIIMLLLSVLVGSYFLKEENEVNTEYLRIHIRANSDSESDQAVKYEIKDVIVGYLSSKIKDVHGKDEAEIVLTENLGKIQNLCDSVLSENGFGYKSSVKINNENFPTRWYDNYCLQSGFYDALIIDLGGAEGDNWWCVVYPPLCFTGKNVNYEYKSKIWEIIREFNNKKGREDYEN